MTAEDKHIAVAPVIALQSANQSDSSLKKIASSAEPLKNSSKKIVVEADDSDPQVRLVVIKTDVAERYKILVPPLPIPPFSTWRKWITAHKDAVHCSLEWRDENGRWFYGEMRSLQFDPNAVRYCVGRGEFPGTAFDAYGVYVIPGRRPRDIDHKGKPIVVVLDEKVQCDYRQLEQEIRKYAAKGAQPGELGTGGNGKHNVGLGGPAYKPTQNSNTMIKYVLRACGVLRSAPPQAVGWDTEPHFPYSTNADAPAFDN
ncbi:MAG: hypothetical protein V1899_09085 [Planctomycetota bacterium]